MVARNGRLEREATVRQDTILLEAIHRIRRHAGLRDDQLHQRPLVIVVTKWDSWKQLLPEIGREEPYKRIEGQAVHALDTKRVQDVSTQVGQLLTKLCPEVVAAAEGFAENLLFIPVSATGRSPELDPDTGSLGIRPSEMDPYWVEVPMMFALHHWAVGLIGASYSKRSHAEADKPIQA